jgi:sugar lactone lactonase YvrE
VIRFALVVTSLAAGLLLAPLAAAAQSSTSSPLEPTAPANLRCPGLIDPGPPPGDPSQYQLQWSWQWQTLISNLPNLRGLALDANCNVYVASTASNTVQQYSPAGALLAQFGIGGAGNRTGQFYWEPFDGLSVDSTGNLLVGDPGRIQEFSPAHQVVHVWADQPQCARAGVPCQVTPDNGLLGSNFQLAVDGTGAISAATTLAGVVRYTESGPLQRTWGPLDPQLSVNGIGLDQAGNVYVTEGYGASAVHRISKLSPDGKLLLQVGGAKGQAPGRFASPSGIGVDVAGNIYVAEAGNNRVQELSPSGEPLQMWADPGLFWNPLELTVDGRGEVFVDDNYNNRVQVYEAIPSWVPINPPDTSSPDSLHSSDNADCGS